MTGGTRRFCHIWVGVLLVLWSVTGGDSDAAEDTDAAGEAKPAKDKKPADEIDPPENKDDALWELGVGGGGGWFPDYPASGQGHIRGLALPFVIYRGKQFQAGERSLARGLFVDTDRFEFDVSFAGSLPADSSDNDAREGLDDLDYLGEIGPRASYYFYRDRPGNQLRLDLQLRAVLSTDFSSFDYVGIVFNPQLVQEFVDVGAIKGLETRWGAGFRLADEGVMDLFYEVPVSGVTNERRRFDASAGYLGANLYGSVSYDVTDRLTFALGANVASYAGATNRDSDLFVDETNFSIGSAVVWTIWESEARSRASW
ncbi:MAG: MipA/OmpV family protein [Geminicoccaceae bacterium]